MCIVTNDGRTLVGELHGFDQMQNIILTKTVERIFAEDEDPQLVELGLYVLRGDNVAVVGEIDEELDAASNPSSIRAAPIKPVVHTAF